MAGTLCELGSLRFSRATSAFRFVNGRSVSDSPVAARGAKQPSFSWGRRCSVSLILGVLLGTISGLRNAVGRQGSNARRPRRDLASVLLGLVACRLGVRDPSLRRLWGSKIFPATGIRRSGLRYSTVLDTIHHMILPVVVLAFAGTATFMRFTRASVLDAMRQELRDARRMRKGVSPAAVAIHDTYSGDALLPA